MVVGSVVVTDVFLWEVIVSSFFGALVVVVVGRVVVVVGGAEVVVVGGVVVVVVVTADVVTVVVADVVVAGGMPDGPDAGRLPRTKEAETSPTANNTKDTTSHIHLLFQTPFILPPPFFLLIVTQKGRIHKKKPRIYKFFCFCYNILTIFPKNVTFPRKTRV